MRASSVTIPEIIAGHISAPVPFSFLNTYSAYQGSYTSLITILVKFTWKALDNILIISISPFIFLVGSAFGHVVFPRRPSDAFDSSCSFASFQSSCRQQTFCTDRPTVTTPLSTSSSMNLSTHPYIHNLQMNSLTPLSSTGALSHPCHAPRPLPHPGYLGHPNEHTIHHTPSHLTAHVHSTLNGYPDSLRQDCRPDYGLGRSDFSKPLTISTTFHTGFPGNPPPYPYH